MPLNKNALVREWVTRFALNAGAALDATALGVFTAMWEDAFSDLSYQVLESALRKTLQICKFWPVKVADIREHIDSTKETALAEAADLEWQKVLTLRRLHYNPDMPQHLARHVRGLSERTQSACRASGVFREFESTEQLHTWAKKRFVESYLAWETLEQGQFLLPEGELRNLIADLAKTKAIPALPSSVENDAT